MKKQWILGMILAALVLAGCTGRANTPGVPEQEEPIQATPEAVDYGGMLQITELDFKNSARLADETGAFPDWIEITNVSDESVSLSGWTASDKPKKRRQALSEAVLAPGECTVVFCTEFGLSEGETVYLIDPAGGSQDQAEIPPETEFSTVLIREEDGSFAETHWPTPGAENTRAGYDAWCEQDTRTGGLQFHEIMVSNEAHPDEAGNYSDWIELKNTGADCIRLAGYCLTKSEGAADAWQLPDVMLAPGELLVISCDGTQAAGEMNTGVSLSAVQESLYLYDPAGKLADYIWLHDIPVEGSMGRMPGRNGFFYFGVPTPGTENEDGKRRVSAAPVCLTEEGPHEADSLSVTLDAEGTIRYTLDGTVPTADSVVYTGPILLDRTAIVRAVAWEEGAQPSRPATFSFFLNEGHTLPILSLVVDDWAQYDYIYTFGIKYTAVPANLALYENGTVFNRACEVSMKGWTSLSMPKKSMGVTFSGRYGGMLNCDVFQNGITEYDALSLRVGQDFHFSVFRNEMVQQLCREASQNLYTQEEKYCVLYVNGEYYGIYCLKDDITRQFYANHAGVSVDSVEGFRAPAAMGSEYYRLLEDYGWYEDLTLEDNYRVMEESINLDSLIDWFLFEAWCANTDTQGNLRVYRSTENGNRWEYVLYDLDWAFHYWEGGFRTILDCIGNAGSEMPTLLNNLLKNRDFRDRLLRRFAELTKTVFDDDYVLQKIDEYEKLLAPEIGRDHERWNLTEQSWTERVQLLRDTIADNDYVNYMISDLCKRIGLTDEERIFYFGPDA